MKLEITAEDVRVSNTSFANCLLANALRRTFGTHDAWVSNNACGAGNMVFALEGPALEIADEFAAGRKIKPTVVELRQVH